MTQDRRKHRRIATSHPAQLIVSDSTTDCQINNFSRGGCSLVLRDTALRAIRDEGRLDAAHGIDALVLLKPDRDGETYRIPVRIVFATDDSIGAAFMRPDPQVLDYLSRCAPKPSPAGRRAVPSSGRLDEIQALLEQTLISRYDGFIPILTETLLELEDHASQQEQPDLRHGRLEIESSVTALRQWFLDQVAEN